ncbi:hypothetical protein [Caballeronia sp. DA-9]|uniref:hypothetical protein n=1 Tax=Caballeronia sp. DA-9 TaxID=3436237 RepID=UPI003F67438F
MRVLFTRRMATRGQARARRHVLLAMRNDWQKCPLGSRDSKNAMKINDWRANVNRKSTAKVLNNPRNQAFSASLHRLSHRIHGAIPRSGFGKTSRHPAIPISTDSLPASPRTK